MEKSNTNQNLFEKIFDDNTTKKGGVQGERSSPF
jgi:hypothetical protein